MRIRKTHHFRILIGFLLLLSACGSASAPAAPRPTAATGDIPQALTPEGDPMLGRADAPVTMQMFSDFL